jgi:hypothetical protein
VAGVIDEWVNRSGIAIDMMGHFDFGDALELDYSADSLRGLATAVAEHFADPAEVLYADEQPLVEGVVAYVGECLLRLARGHWEWDDAPGFAERGRPALGSTDLVARLDRYRWRFDDIESAGVPLVYADDALELEPVSPLHVLLAQLGDQFPAGVGSLVDVFARWQRAVSAYGTAHPEWVKVLVPTLTDGMPIMPDSPILDDWLERQRADFPQWASTYGGTWDYTLETLDTLAALVFRRTPSVAAFEDPANADFAEGASWYFGEMLCRAYPARWMYRAYLREPGDPLPVCFTVQTNDNRDFTGPYVRISNMLKRDDPGWLRVGYDQWADNA